MKSKILISLSLSLLTLFLNSEKAFSYPSTYRNVISDEFSVPQKLRSRVDFWKDVFTKYDKAHIIIHHREYPQIVFNVINLEPEFDSMSEAQFYNFRKGIEKHEVAVVRQAIEELADSEQPSTQLQKTIAQKMQYFGPGTAKYRKILKNDLIRTQTGIREKYGASVRRAGRYLPIIERIFVEEHGLPVELTRIPFIESSFDYTAYSSVGAAGIWQFMPKTAKLYMTVNKVVDERRDPIEASRAAAKYLRSAYMRLNSWPLAVTSYNHGVAGVAKKVSTLGTSDLFELIEQPEDKLFGFASSNFYPEFLAAVEIYADYQHYFPGLQLEPAIRAKEVVIDRPVTASYMADYHNAGIQTLQSLNYALSKSVWEGKAKIPAGYSLKVPANDYLHVAYNNEAPRPPIVVEAPSQSQSSTIYGGVTYRVRRGDTLISIAKKYGVSVSDLKALNGISSNSLSVGKVLTVRQRENLPERKTVTIKARGEVVTKETTPSKPAKQQKTYKVKSGDSLWTIGIKYGVTVDALKKANKGELDGNRLTGGQTIIIP